MKAYSSAFLLLALAMPAYADDIAMEDQSQIPTAAAELASEHYFQPPLESELPDNAYGKLVQEGRALFVDTKNRAPEHVGNGLSCANCHLDQGRKANSAPLWGAYTMYPAYRSKNDKVNSYADRVQGCFQFSMNGKAPAADGPIIAALSAYSYWLATGAPTGQELPGRAYPEVPEPEGGYDLVKGEQIYAAQCAVCHGESGEGQKSGEDFVFPPLWGADSFNWGAGMHRINTAAAFIKESMPLGKGGTLSNEDAWHVAAFMNSHERPQDPRLVDGSVEKTRDKYHANDGVNLYGKTVNGQMLGKGL
ncbi:c-type cytochrome [Halopseudomonas pelagia]|uniref:c-type cytochrome n=1 Tax=Halopseudomonas pelagia TaxID=553151 RepID=UPI0030DC6BF4|tara:strand:- start:55331 stop:56248 length:918 start_codon:yes stop_codon:yes gene_type:complete